MSTLELLHEVACIIFLNLVFALRMYHFVSAPQQAVHSEVCKRRATGEEYAAGGAKPSRTGRQQVAVMASNPAIASGKDGGQGENWWEKHTFPKNGL